MMSVRLYIITFIGDHNAASSHWIDAGYDTAAAIVPFVPAGVTKVKNARNALNKAKNSKTALNNANQAKKAASKSASKENGKSVRDSTNEYDEYLDYEDMRSKSRDKKHGEMGGNQRENKQAKAARRKGGINDKKPGERKRHHDSGTKDNNGKKSFKEMIEDAKDISGKK